MKTFSYPLALCIAICTSAQAIVTSDGPGTHVVSQMTGTYGLNLDGVALIGGTLPDGAPSGFCSGALITDRHVLTTVRCFDSNFDLHIDERLFLSPTEVLLEIDGNWIGVDYDPAKIVWSDDWETSPAGVAIVTLEGDPPSSVPRYALYGGNDEVGQSFVLAGYGFAGFGPMGFDPDLDPVRTKRAGRNQYDALTQFEDAQILISDFDSGRPEHNSLVDLGFGDEEVLAAPYDDGGPEFLGGAIAGVVAGGHRMPDLDATDKPDSSWGERDYSSRVSVYKDFILAATDGEAVFVMPGEPSMLGDFDDDQLLTSRDMDLLSRAIRFGIDHVSFDINEDDAVNQSDRETWVRDVLGTLFGDADLNQAVEFADFLALSDSFNKKGGWGDGDFDGSGQISFPDFLLLSANFGESVPKAAAVPEPTGVCLLMFGFFAVIGFRPRSYATLARVNRFPYLIFFAIRKTHVSVVAVVHDSSDPGKWRSRKP